MIEAWDQLDYILPTLVVRLGVAFLCGIALGLERELKDKPAGLRTIVLITTGSALFIMIASLLPYIMDWPEDIVRADPTRIIAHTISGIGFLGAGTIIQARGSVQGLTTAAVIWVSAGIGIAAGIGLPMLAVVFTAAVLLILVALNPLRHWLSMRGTQKHVTLLASDDLLVLGRIRYVLQNHDVQEDQIHIVPEAPETLKITFAHHDEPEAAARMFEALAHIEGVRGAHYLEHDSRDIG